MFRERSCGHVHVRPKSVDVDHLVMKLCLLGSFGLPKNESCIGDLLGVDIFWPFVIDHLLRQKKIRVFKAM